MIKIKIITIVGTRPNFIKVAPLLEELKLYKNIHSILVHTGQHYDYKMSRAFFQDLRLPQPNYHLGVGSGLHADQTARTMLKLEPVLLKERPDWVIVVGDVNSTLAGALVAAKLQIPIAHIEAGLRSYDRNMPEEINRVLTDHLSKLLFCPTKTAVENLHKEGIKKGIYLVGDIMYDALVNNIKVAEKKSKILNILKLKPKEYILLTVHRPHNADNPENLKKILEAIKTTGKKTVFPIHPRTKKMIKDFVPENKYYKNIVFTEPVGYIDMLVLEKNAEKILTDSGGVQKEAYWFKIPCITLRNTTEWIETIEAGLNVLVGADKKKIINAINKLPSTANCKSQKIYGKGNTAKLIIEIIKQ